MILVKRVQPDNMVEMTNRTLSEESRKTESQISYRNRIFSYQIVSKKILRYRFIFVSLRLKSYQKKCNYSGIRSGEIAEKLAISNPTVKRTLSDLQNKGMIEKQGSGRGTVYIPKNQ